MDSATLSPSAIPAADQLWLQFSSSFPSPDRKDQLKEYSARLKNVPTNCFDAFDSDEDAPDPIEDEHHAIFECSAYATTRQMFSDLFPSHVSTVSQFLNQPDCNRLAKFLTWIRMLRLNTA